MARSFVTILTIVAVSLISVLTGGCESSAQTGAALGGLTGAGIGAIVGHQSGRATEGALIGGAVGTGAGYLLGNEQDKKEAQAEMSSLREEANYATVNITNSNGSICQVMLRKQGVGYVGTRGEFYNQLPTEDQLRPVYGF
ncbi:MAG: glycine zipper domain-containing protein [Planctomycetota bacterium]|nr:glycine zipper domain-containing protein [Planctomycetota bacterium]